MAPRDPETGGGTPAKGMVDHLSAPYADTDRNSAAQRRPEANTPIPGPRNHSNDGAFTSWNGAAGGVNGPADPEIPTAP